MDPFIQVIHSGNGTKYQTKVIEDGGSKPVWNEMLEIPIEGKEDELEIKCLDKNVLKDECVAAVTLKASQLVS